jgi:hypothetical protein
MTYLRKAIKASTTRRTEFRLDNHDGSGHSIPEIPDLDVTDDVEVVYGSEK